MKRIGAYKKMFNVESEIDLKEIKKSYRNLVKEWHPDKFQEGDEKAKEAEIKSKEIIDGYHFLVSIAPETREANLEEYNNTINTSAIVDFDHKKQILELIFADGTTYEYFGVPTNIFHKLVNTDKRTRFAKRSIFHSYTYRKAKKATEE